jgi:hypothetical protein
MSLNTALPSFNEQNDYLFYRKKRQSYNGQVIEMNILKKKLKLFFLGAKSTSILDCVRRSVGRSVGPPRCAITWKNNSYVAIDSRRGGGRGN